MPARARLVASFLVVPLLALVPAATTTHPSASRTAVEETAAVTPGVRVLAVSIDGLNPTALTRLGRTALPHFWRLLDEGATTLNARTQYELTKTLPNHTSMVTGRRIARRAGGHGVRWNYERGAATVQKAAGEPVHSVFSVVRRAGGSSALFSTKGKFRLFKRSWPAGVDRIFVREQDDLAVTKAAAADLVARRRAFTFVHLGLADQAGHAHGFMSPAYLRAVDRADALLGRLLRAIGRKVGGVVVLTADHGGLGPSHFQVAQLGDYRIPFVVWGPGVQHGDLYAMNPTYANPRRTRPRPVGRQPVRNGDLPNLVTDLLGLGPVPGSQFNVRQRLRVLAD
ncbi:alkaline phosphatase family protein [Nocardioides sp. cx-169]|uniref:alkaline phosphatase family protein n=1 Tax=Nocardioides sp. cx-169 TaxID=2899080 RepID=UPI001E30ED75|nr:alkaline phosphatase family protein [Nocardioides sp. cx-169]MCD4533994.1 alkaline phosphatase family protein [Nocardioides sp. cx-169]